MACELDTLLYDFSSECAPNTSQNALTNRIDESEANVCKSYQQESAEWSSMHLFAGYSTSSPKRYAELMSQIAVA